jgi:NTE family protein
MEENVSHVTLTRHTAETYVPQTKRFGMALCLSGGGYRAALFHLGALRRLHQLGVLPQVTTISSVSGGSILSAFLTTQLAHWSHEAGARGEAMDDVGWERTIAAPFRGWAGRNLRTPAVLQRLLPWKWFNSSAAVEAMADLLQQRLAAQGLTSQALSDLPVHPHFCFCATDLSFGTNWVFEKERMGGYAAGYLKPPAEWTVARAAAISSCFPPVFNPWRLQLSPSSFCKGSARNRVDYPSLISGLRLSDGGVYDNMALEPVWKSHQTLLVSDGGSPFGYAADRGLLSRLFRYQTIVSHQARVVRKRWLIAGFVKREFAGCYWSVGSSTSHYDSSLSPTYSSDLVEQVIAPIRTDLDAFSEAEAKVLENHGYLLAEAALQRHSAHLITCPASCSVPHPEWMDEDRIKRELAQSRSIRTLGRF